MATIFETIQTEGIAEVSYLLGDDEQGVAAVFDPTADVEKYIERARETGLVITHVFETHIHADLVSGVRELADRTRNSVIYLSAEGEADYGFDCEAIRDGDTFYFGDTKVVVRHTPGHTPEHVSYELATKGHPSQPWGVLTGDSRFLATGGRADPGGI